VVGERRLTAAGLVLVFEEHIELAEESSNLALANHSVLSVQGSNRSDPAERILMDAALVGPGYSHEVLCEPSMHMVIR